MVISMIEAFGEAYATLRKAGVAPASLLSEIMNTLFGSAVSANGRALHRQDKFEPAGIARRLGLKDVRLALVTAEECTSPMPLASLVHDQLLSALAQGQGELDWSSVARVGAECRAIIQFINRRIEDASIAWSTPSSASPERHLSQTECRHIKFGPARL